jgi:uncharacterized protein YbjT (DUF2867 family)
MEDKKTAIVVGATGLIGSYVVNLLKDKDEFGRIIILGRRDIEIQHPKIEVFITDFQDLDKFNFWADADCLFCCIGTTIAVAGTKENFRKVDYGIPKSLCTYCENYNISFLLVSSVGADKNSSNFYLKTKGETEDAVINSGIKTVHIFRPSMLLGPRKEKRLGEQIGKIFMQITNPLMLGGLKRYKAVKAETVANAMINESLKNESGIFIHENEEILNTQ